MRGCIQRMPERSFRIAFVEAVIRAYDHHVRAGVDPVVVRGRARRIGIRAFGSMRIGSGPGVPGLSGMQLKPFVPLRTVRMLPGLLLVWIIDGAGQRISMHANPAR
jgi:hypothetical protein